MKSRILVIDDDETVRQCIEKGLSISQNHSESMTLSQKKAELFGNKVANIISPFMPGEIFEVVVSDSGELGLSLIKKAVEANNPFQIVFLDIRMPGMSGDECGRKIRSLDNKIGICFITGYSDKNAVELVKKVGGAVDKILFLKKPFDYDEIRQIARAFSAKWFAEIKSEAFQEGLKTLIHSIVELKYIVLNDLRKLLQTVLYQVLKFIDAKNGFIASIDLAGSLQFEIGAGKFVSPDDIKDIHLPENSMKNYVIKKHNNNIIIPMSAMEYHRVIVVVDQETIMDEHKYFIEIFTENASIALANAGLFQELQDAKESLESKVKERTSELQKSNQHLQDMAIKDPLTSLYNRRHFNTMLEKEVKRAKMCNSELILLIIDIDYFKSINDQHGHGEGDIILVRLATILCKDLLDVDIVARYGGDEFVILLPNIQLSEACTIAERISKLYNNLALDGRYPNIDLTLSIGIAHFNDNVYYTKNGKELFKKADEALYMAKRNGRNRVETWRPSDELAASQPDILWNEIDHLLQLIESLSRKTKDNYTEELFSIISFIESKDPNAGIHSKKVAHYTKEFLQCLQLEKKYVDEICTASVLHDVGKIGVPNSILQKNKLLADDEWSTIKYYLHMSIKIMKRSNYLGKEILIVKHHHEKYDGTGYPDGLKGKNIPFGSRIINITNSFDAMTNTRPYRKAMNIDESITEMISCRGTQFDPELLDIFIALVEKNRAIWPVE